MMLPCHPSSSNASKRTSRGNQFKGIIFPPTEEKDIQHPSTTFDSSLEQQKVLYALDDECTVILSNENLICGSIDPAANAMATAATKGSPCRVTAYCTADRYHHQEWHSSWKRLIAIWCQYYPKSVLRRWDDTVVYLSMPPTGHVFIFEYGVIVFWCLEKKLERSVLSLCRLIQAGKAVPEDELDPEEFKYVFSPEETSSRILNDVIFLKSEHLIYKLILSHALAQSAKLTIFEGWIEKSVRLSGSLTGSIHLFHHGASLSRTKITKDIGHFFDFLIKIHWRSDVLGDSPEFLWHMPSVLTPFYKCFHQYLEIGHRSDVLRKKCNVLSDALAMLRSHINDSQRATLLRIIISVIFLQVIIAILRIVVEVYL